ncbi:MAG TPA: hypothetical protein VK034_14565 [Enhygromyxa sp.]|nr:hypothetical protein [Enhygromyxa sp.]
MSDDELRRALGFDELTYEECARELFGELFDLPPRPPASGPTRVTQMGPGRRSTPRPRAKTKEK